MKIKCRIFKDDDNPENDICGVESFPGSTEVCIFCQGHAGTLHVSPTGARWIGPISSDKTPKDKKNKR